MAENEKLTTGANDRPKDEPIAQTASGLPDDSSSPVEVDDETVEKMRQKLQNSPKGAEPEDRSPARQKDQAQSDSDAKEHKVPGAEEIDGAGAEEDTYD